MAQRDLARLERLSDHAEQLRAVRIARTRYCTPALAALLLDNARSAVRDDPEESGVWAELAAGVAWRAEDGQIEALAFALSGNAARAQGNLLAAEERFARMRQLLRLWPADSLTLAECDSLEASLRKDQRDFERARHLLQRATSGFQSAGSSAAALRVQLNLSDVERLVGNLDEAFRQNLLVLERIEPRSEPRLHVLALHNLVLDLLLLGEPAKARDMIALIRPLIPTEREVLHAIRLDWLEGRIAAALQDHETASLLLDRAMSRFLERRSPVLAAFVALDLAGLWLEQGSTEELRSLAGCLPSIFASQRLHREANTVLLMLVRAIRKDELTRSILDTMRARLERYQDASP
jgi:tetratricopeptide (TPR) repeat protein